MKRVAHTRAKGERADVTQRTREFWRYADKVLLAYGNDFNGIRVLEGRSAGVDIGRLDLLG